MIWLEDRPPGTWMLKPFRAQIWFWGIQLSLGGWSLPLIRLLSVPFLLQCAQLAGSLAVIPSSLMSRRAKNISLSRSECSAILGQGCSRRPWRPNLFCLIFVLKTMILHSARMWCGTGRSLLQGLGTPAFLPLDGMTWARPIDVYCKGISLELL